MQNFGLLTHLWLFFICQGDSTNPIVCKSRGVFPTNPHHNYNKYVFISALGIAIKEYKT